MALTKLTSSFVREVTEQVPPVRDTAFFDVALPRFALRVKPPRQPGSSWAAWYFVRYTAPGGTERRLKVGDPRTMSLDAARHAAKVQLAMVDSGRDPVREKNAARTSWSIEQACEAYLVSPEFAAKTSKTQICDRSTFRNHILHHLGKEKLADMDVPMVRRLIRAVEADTRKNARKRRLGGSGAARKVVRVLSAVCTWAVGEGHLSHNPIVGNLRLTGDGSRDTVITEPAQYAELLATMDRLVDSGTLRPQSRAFVIVAAATGMRRSELQTLTWGQIDLVERRLTLTTSKGSRLARSGPKTENVSLPPIAAAALAQICPGDPASDDRVFVPQRGEVLEINRDWVKIRAAAGLPKELTLHGLRHSVGTAGIMAGLTTAEVQKLLRHRNISTTAKYVHLADRARLQDRAVAHLFTETVPFVEAPRLFARRSVS